MGLFDSAVDFLGTDVGKIAAFAIPGAGLTNLVGQEVKAGFDRRESKRALADALIPPAINPLQTSALGNVQGQSAQSSRQISQAGQASQERIAQENQSLDEAIAEIERRRRNAETGASVASDLQLIGQSQSGTQQNILRGGGSSSAVLQALAQSQQGVGNAINQRLAQSDELNTALLGLQSQVEGRNLDLLNSELQQNRATNLDLLQSQLGFGQLEAGIRNRIEDRGLQIPLLQASILRAEAAQGEQNLFNLLNTVLGVGGTLGKAAIAG